MAGLTVGAVVPLPASRPVVIDNQPGAGSMGAHRRWPNPRRTASPAAAAFFRTEMAKYAKLVGKAGVALQ